MPAVRQAPRPAAPAGPAAEPAARGPAASASRWWSPPRSAPTIRAPRSGRSARAAAAQAVTLYPQVYRHRRRRSPSRPAPRSPRARFWSASIRADQQVARRAGQDRARCRPRGARPRRAAREDRATSRPRPLSRRAPGGPRRPRSTSRSPSSTSPSGRSRAPVRRRDRPHRHFGRRPRHAPRSAIATRRRHVDGHRRLRRAGAGRRPDRGRRGGDRHGGGASRRHRSPAEISAIDNRIDPTTRTMRVEATLPNDADVLKPGMAITIDLVCRRRDAPVGALARHPVGPRGLVRLEARRRQGPPHAGPDRRAAERHGHGRRRTHARRRGRGRGRAPPPRGPDGGQASTTSGDATRQRRGRARSAEPGPVSGSSRPRRRAPRRRCAKPARGGEDGQPEERRESLASGAGIAALFVSRPVLAIVLNLLIVVAGVAAFGGVEIRELPNIDRPVITIRTNYDGATPGDDRQGDHRDDRGRRGAHPGRRLDLARRAAPARAASPSSSIRRPTSTSPPTTSATRSARSAASPTTPTRRPSSRPTPIPTRSCGCR